MARNPNSDPSNQNRPPREDKPPMSKESKFIGFLVLGFGVLAIITVLILAFGGEKEVAVSYKKVEPVRNLAPELMPNKRAAAVKKATPKKDELLFKRNPDFDAAKMNGEWQAMIGKYTAVLQIDKNVYQVILATQDPMGTRVYSSGTFKVLEDLVMLMPRRDWPKPASASKDIKYRSMTSAQIPVVAFFDGEEMIWQNPPKSEKRVLSPYKSPLMMSQDQEAILWKRLK